jgi:hypothetical protein
MLYMEGAERGMGFPFASVPVRKMRSPSDEKVWAPLPTKGTSDAPEFVPPPKVARDTRPTRPTTDTAIPSQSDLGRRWVPDVPAGEVLTT